MFEVIKQILRLPNKISIKFPYSNLTKHPSYFGDSELADILSFGFSYVEHEDHCVEYLLVSPITAKRVIKEIESFNLTVDTDCLGLLWTAQVLLTDKIKDDQIFFANRDLSVILDLNTNKMEDYNADV